VDASGSYECIKNCLGAFISGKKFVDVESVEIGKGEDLTGARLDASIIMMLFVVEG
jgi:hypothetical protein